ncbi:MAG: Septum formation protein Maf [uncultured Sphingomonas sp.]|uniref:Nucleoside triphosphate pyrophosphatase n=1 Tax=uncultured Sphingomonas sp. TaxID=158754 RepID=A0A6J4SX60_9SPHN|nr:MAG: Septum formation protein Maf [uncultured Sphingomonas sp.]
MTLILASTSAIRRSMLSAAGVGFEAVAPNVDEAAIKATLPVAANIASELAAAKALAVSAKRLEEWVIGSDSVVEVDGRDFSKPANLADAADHLRFFSGKAMRLTSAVALARFGGVDWNHQETATLNVRQLSDQFIDDYLAAEWPQVGYCVGVFRMEARGVQLFESVDGDHFTILGMPLLPLLGALRTRRLLPA